MASHRHQQNQPAEMPMGDRLLTFAGNIGRLFSDLSYSFIDKYLLCGGGGGDGASSSSSIPSAKGHTQQQQQVRTFQDVWKRCAAVHGEDRMNIIYYTVMTFFTIIVLKVVWEIVKLFSAPAGLKKATNTNKGSSAQSKNAVAAAVASKDKKKGGKKDTNVDDEAAANDSKAAAAADSSTSSSTRNAASSSTTNTPAGASPSVAAIVKSETFVFAKALIEASQAADGAEVPTPTSQIFGAGSSAPTAGGIIKPTNKTAFPSRVGVMMTSPCQQYWVVSCRSTLEARVYPQSHKPQVLSKGSDLAKKHFLNLGYVLGPVLGTNVVNVAGTTNSNNNCPSIDISIAAFMSSTPLSSIHYSDESAAAAAGKKGYTSSATAAGSSSSDSLILDGSSAYLVVGESQKDTYVILRLSNSTTPSATSDESDAAAASDDKTRSSAAKLLANHYRTTSVRAEVLWLYRRPNHRLAWDTYRFGLFSSFACAPTGVLSFASAYGTSNRPIFGAGAGSEHALLSSMADDHAYGSIYGGAASSSSPSSSSKANIADILVFGNSEDCSIEMVHRSHVGDGFELTPWGSYASEGKDKKKAAAATATNTKGGKGGKAAAASSPTPSNVNPLLAVYAEADADWHPQHLKAGQTYAVRTKNNNKFTVGHSAAMHLSDPVIVCCGTFSTDPSVSQLTLPRYPLSTGAAGPTTTKELLQTYAVDRFFPAEAMKPRGAGGSHSVSVASAPTSVQPQKLKIPRIIPSYLADLSALVTKVANSSMGAKLIEQAAATNVSSTALLSSFINIGSAETFSRSGFAVQQVAIVNPYQPASTLAYNAGAGSHRPCFCVVFCDNGCGFVFDIATTWESATASSGGHGGAVGGSSNSNAQDVLHSYSTYSGEDGSSTTKKAAINPIRRSADRPIAAFYDVSFARKEARAPTTTSTNGPTSPTGAVTSASSSAIIGGCDQLLVAVAGVGPHYSLRIALVSKARRAISVYATTTSHTTKMSTSSATSFIDAPLTDNLLKIVATAKDMTADNVVTAATNASNLPANTTVTTYTDAFTAPVSKVVAWRDMRPTYNRYGEANTIEHCCFIQNGIGIATVGNDDGLGILMHQLTV